MISLNLRESSSNRLSFGRWPEITAALAIFAEIIQTFLAGKPAFIGFIPGINWVNIFYFIGAFVGVPACVLWIGGVCGPLKALSLRIAVAIGACIYIYQMVANDGSGLYAASSVICLVLAPLGAYALVSTAFNLRSLLQKNDEWPQVFLKTAILLDSLTVATNAGLHNNKLLYPVTWDYFLYRIDGAFSGLATNIAIANIQAAPAVQAFTVTAYGILVFVFFIVVGLAIRQNEVSRLNIWRVLIVPFILAFFLYSFLPLSGPIYTFFSGEFPSNMPTASSVIASPVVIPPAYRNGMPSMHLTGAFLVLMLAISLRHRIAILGATALVASTVWSTLATGEHYFLDLVVALPYSVFLGTLLIFPSNFFARLKISAPIWCAAALFFCWLTLIRFAPQWLAEQTKLVLFLSVLSLLSTLIVLINFSSEAYGKKQRPDELPPAYKDQLSGLIEPKAPRWLIAAFFASGVAGLLYEVVYAKALGIMFGSTALASYTVLMTYMGGMALGAGVGGYLTDRLKRPLYAYAVCEAAIGIYAIATPMLFTWMQTLYVSVALDSKPDAQWLSAFRVILGILCLGIPTMMMGATLPLAFRHLRDSGVSSKSAIAPLYGANVIGAAIGSLIAGYWLLPTLGRNGATYIAAALSMLVALYVLHYLKGVKTTSDSRMSLPTVASTGANGATAKLALLILFAGGAVTLGLEINSMHLLAVVAGNSVYAFGLMLFAFLIGLGVGSKVGEAAIKIFPRITIVAWAQCGIALAVGITAHQWDNLPSYFSSFGIYPVVLDFSARETIRAIVCITAMFPAAFFIGLSYPSAMSLAGDWISPNGGARGVGLASAINTFGNITGVLVVGFWLLPQYGSRESSLILGVLALCLGAAAILIPELQKDAMSLKSRWAIKLSPVVAGAVALICFPSQWNYDDLASGGNVYFSSQNWGKVVDHAESVEGGLTSVAENADKTLTLLTNGKFQGNNSEGGEMVAQESFALIPLLHTSERRDALVIGYGTGMTTRVLQESGFHRVDVAELSRDIVTLADKHFANINHRVTVSPNVDVHYTDGRNFLLTQTKKFDLISIEITSIWFAGAANLYNQNFYALAKSRLGNSGILQQWVQLHHISAIDLAYVIGSVRSEFQFVWLYVRGGQGIIVASNNSDSLKLPGRQLVSSFINNPLDERSPDQLISHLLLSPAGIDRFIGSFNAKKDQIISTDENLYLEYSTPKGNALGDVLQANIRLLGSFEPGATSLP